MIVEYFSGNAADHCIQMERPQQRFQDGVEGPQCASPATLREDKRRSQGSWALDRRRDSGRKALEQPRVFLVEVAVACLVSNDLYT
jgi:hypothetical protein